MVGVYRMYIYIYILYTPTIIFNLTELQLRNTTRSQKSFEKYALKIDV